MKKELKITNLFQKIKSILKGCGYYILGAICVILLVLLTIVIKRHPKEITITRDNLDLLKKTDSITDLNGEYWRRIEGITIDLREAKLRNDSLARALKLKPKTIKGQDIYVSKTDTVFNDLKTIYVTSDSTYRISKKDGYVDITAIVGKNTGSIQYKGYDTLTRVEVVKNPLIGRSKRYVYLHNASPYNKIGAGMSYVTKEKDVWLSIGPSIQYNPLQNTKVTVGVSVQIPIIKFKR